MLAPSPPSEEATIDAPAVYAVAGNRELLIEALNERRIELRMAMVELDDIAGLATGASGKFLGPSAVKNLGVHTLLKMTHALGLTLILEIDPERTAEVVQCRRPMNPNQVRQDNFSQAPGQRTIDRMAEFFVRADKHNGRRRAKALRRLVIDWNEARRVVSKNRESHERRAEPRHLGLRAHWASRRKGDA